jgi:hypothetical protein
VTLRSLTVRAAARSEVAPVAKRGQVAEVAVSYDHDVSAAATITTVGAATRDVGLAAEADAAVSTGTGFHLHFYAVVEHDQRARLADRDDAALAAGLELDRAGASGKDRVVPADSGAGAGLEARTSLAHDDLAATHLLAGEQLHAKALCIRVAAVAA